MLGEQLICLSHSGCQCADSQSICTPEFRITVRAAELFVHSVDSFMSLPMFDRLRYENNGIVCPQCGFFHVSRNVSLFVFSIDGPKQNATSLLTPVSDIVFYALSSGTLGFALHGSFNNHLHERIRLAVEEFPAIRKWFKDLPWRARPRVSRERA